MVFCMRITSRLMKARICSSHNNNIYALFENKKVKEIKNCLLLYFFLDAIR